MTIFLVHAPQDLAAAESLAKSLERRGIFVDLEDGEQAMRPIGPNDAVVGLVSKDFVFSPWRLRLEKRLLDAWAEERLVMVKLDHAFAPVGLRDLPFIDASFEAQRDFTWGQVGEAVRGLAPPPEPQATPAPSPDRKRQTHAKERPPMASPAPRKGGLMWLVATALILVALVGAALGGLYFGAPLGLPALEGIGTGMNEAAWRVLLIGGAVVLGLLVMAIIAVAVGARKPRLKVAPPAASAPAPQAEKPVAPVIFVSYARADRGQVDPVVVAVEAAGRAVWIDRAEIGAGEGWAGEIVRAIRGAGHVLVMCSARAFESDHVKREVYLADKYKKPLLPVFLEDAAPPEDFEYFFAHLQPLRLHEAAGAEHGAAVVKALGA